MVVEIPGFKDHEIWRDVDDPDVVAIWSPNKRGGAGFIEPYIGTDGYERVNMRADNSKRYTLKVHRLTAKCFIPNPADLETVDHIDGDPANNRISNLRWASRSTQQRNRKSTKGYTWNKQKNKWQAKINIEGRDKHLGYFNTIAAARAAYCAAHNLLFSEACVLE